MGLSETTAAKEPSGVVDWMRRRMGLVVSLALVTGIAVIYVQTARFEFINFDDGEYVYHNEHVTNRLSLESVSWAFTQSHAANWHPLTWLSHMLDWAIFGNWAGGHHLTNAFIHAANSVLLFAALRRLTGNAWPSALTAAVFAFHPLHVESVAWVAERKDVLSGFFFMLTLHAYAGYARRPNWLRYAGVAAAFSAGLLAKPMLVTLPCVLLLLDYWPLGRLGRPGLQGKLGAIAEKIPLLALSAGASVATVLAQGKAGAFAAPVDAYDRCSNAAASYFVYLFQNVYPLDLAIYYPHPASIGQHIPLLAFLASLAALAGISLLLFALRRRHPYLIVGWLWYLGMLTPVLGIVQVGGQARADRYMYLPQIGLCIGAIWLVFGQVSSFWIRRGAALLIAAFLILAFRQTMFWKDSESVFGRAIELSASPLPLAETCYGDALLDKNRSEEGIAHIRIAYRCNPSNEKARAHLAEVLVWRGDKLAREDNLPEAAACFEEALELDPGNPIRDQFALITLAQGGIMLRTGRPAEANRWFHRAVQLKPNNGQVHYNMGRVLLDLGYEKDALACFHRAQKLDPDNADVRKAIEMLTRKS